MLGFTAYDYELYDFRMHNPEFSLHLNCALDSHCLFTHGVHNTFFDNSIMYKYIFIYLYLRQNDHKQIKK